MDTGTISALASLEGLSLEQIAALDTTEEILRRIVPAVPVAAFQSAI
jgi:hypothetical protein